MTTDAAAFTATFSDWRTVKSRKALQLVLEVPLEQQGQVLAILGAPMPDNPKWVAVALLDPKATQEAPQKERRRFDEMPLPSQAALLCQDERFQAWMRDQYDCIADGATAADLLREWCAIDSRAELATDMEAADRFLLLVARYRQETGQTAERRG